ncbi:MAG: anti-sigma factor family protein [Eubacteriales bacterium]
MESLCNNFEEMMFDFIDGELTKPHLEEFKDHLNGCIPCQNELKRRIKTIELIADSVYIPKKNLKESVINNIKLLKKNKLRIRYGSTIAACVVAVVILTNFAFMYMFQNNINKSDDRAVQEDIDSSENNLKSFGIEKNKDDPNEETVIAEAAPPLQGIAGFEHETENETASETSETALPLSDTLNLESAADMIVYNTQLYAPDYLGKVSMVILSEAEADADGMLLKDASNYKVYIFDYTPETAELLQQSADNNGSTVYADQSIDASYILYIYLTQS